MPLPTRKGFRRNKRIEDGIHVAVAQFLGRALPPVVAWTTIGHGGFVLPIYVGVQLKARGVHAGWPDIVLVHPYTGVAHFIELKAPGGRLNPAQREVHPRLMNSRSPVTVCRSVEQVEHFLRACNFPLITTFGAAA